MSAQPAATPIAGRELTLFRLLFLVAAVWNFAGAVPGLADPAGMFEREFGRALTDPVMVAVYRGAWGTALLYGFGFLLVARHPMRHTGIIIMGGTGKALFALNLFQMFLNDWTSAFAIIVIAGDVVFVALFVFFLYRMKSKGLQIL